MTLTPEEQRALVERVRKWADAELIDDSSVLSYWRVEGILKVCDIAASATKRAEKFKAERDAANESAERMAEALQQIIRNEFSHSDVAVARKTLESKKP